jgi:hypothetical protein
MPDGFLAPLVAAAGAVLAVGLATGAAVILEAHRFQPSVAVESTCCTSASPS